MKKLYIIALLAFSFMAMPNDLSAQFIIGGNAATMTYFEKSDQRTGRMGAGVELGLALGDKGFILLNPRLYFPVEYNINRKFMDDQSKEIDVNYNEENNLLMTSLLLGTRIVGDKNSSASLYAAGGVGYATYNINVKRTETQSGIETTLNRDFNDLLLDIRFGGDLQVLEIMRIFLEGQLAPTLVSNFELQPDYTPARGSIAGLNAGIRFQIGGN